MEKAERHLNDHALSCPRTLELCLGKMGITSDDEGGSGTAAAHMYESESSSKENKNNAETSVRATKKKTGTTSSKKTLLSSSSRKRLPASPSSATPTPTLQPKASKKKRVKNESGFDTPLASKSRLGCVIDLTSPGSPMMVSPGVVVTRKKPIRKSSTCKCPEYRIVRFHVLFLRFLCIYAQHRQRQLDEMTRLIDARLKLKGDARL